MNAQTTQQALTPSTVKVGDGVTERIGSDRRAGTVTWVSKSGKTLRFTHDNATMKPGHTIYTAQEYDYESVEEKSWEDHYMGPQTNARTARWSEKRQRFVVTGGHAISAGRNHYYDPSF